jgi:hypothetical protein
MLAGCKLWVDWFIGLGDVGVGPVPPEDGRLTPKTCGGLRHNKVFVKIKVY